MKIESIRTLYGQATAIGLLLIGSAMVACLMGSQRWWFEKHIHEEYTPGSLRSVPTTVREVEALSPSDRIGLYEDWVARPGGSPSVPSLLLKADTAASLARVEKTFVSGSQEQKERALEFLESAGNCSAIPVLARSEQRARRRREYAWAGRLRACARKLRSNGDFPGRPR